MGAERALRGKAGAARPQRKPRQPAPITHRDESWQLGAALSRTDIGSRARSMTELQSTAGNHAVQRLVQPLPTVQRDPASPGPRENDKYFSQDVSHYEDTDDDVARVWQAGSSAATVCNMTSLTMSLVSMSTEDDLRTRLIALLRSHLHQGASVQIGGRVVLLSKALANTALLSHVRTIDLVTAVALAGPGSTSDVTKPDTIMRVAELTGLAHAKGGAQKPLSDDAVKADVAARIARGERVILGTVMHYVYLIGTRDDGVVVHDPAGARVTPTLAGKIFLHEGEVPSIAREFFAMDQARQDRARTRVQTNPRAAAVVTELTRIGALPKAERPAALKALAIAQPGQIDTGALNFYPTAEFAENQLRVMVTLTATP